MDGVGVGCNVVEGVEAGVSVGNGVREASADGVGGVDDCAEAALVCAAQVTSIAGGAVQPVSTSRVAKAKRMVMQFLGDKTITSLGHYPARCIYMS